MVYLEDMLWLVRGEGNVQLLRRIFGGAAAVVGQSIVHVRSKGN